MRPVSCELQLQDFGGNRGSGVADRTGQGVDAALVAGPARKRVRVGVSLVILDRVGFALEAAERCDRAKGLLHGDHSCRLSHRSAPSARRSRRLAPPACPRETTLAPFLTASAMCASTFSTAFMSISGPITAPGPTSICYVPGPCEACANRSSFVHKASQPWYCAQARCSASGVLRPKWPRSLGPACRRYWLGGMFQWARNWREQLFGVSTLQNRIATLDRSDQAFAFHQR